MLETHPPAGPPRTSSVHGPTDHATIGGAGGTGGTFSDTASGLSCGVVGAILRLDVDVDVET